MIVSCTPHFPQQSWDKTVYVAKYTSGMLYHFQHLHFGEGLREIVYHAVAGDDVFLFSFGEGMTYGRKSKSIGDLFKMDYEMILSLEGEALLQYVSQYVIAETTKIAEKKVKDFDLEGYIKSLADYFAEALTLMKNGKSPGEGKVLDEAIQMEIAKKMLKL